MRIRSIAPAMALGVSLGALAPAYAHHGWEAYDDTKQTKLTLKIDKLAFANPHGELWATHEGKPVYVLLSPPARMVDRGLTADMMPVGETVTVEVQPSTQAGSNEWKAISIAVDGKTYSLMR
jgi:hypothetical protein